MRPSLLLLALCAALCSLPLSPAAALTASLQSGQGGSHWNGLFSGWSSAFTASDAWTSAFSGAASYSGTLSEDARAALPWMQLDATDASLSRGNTSYIVTDLALTASELSTLSQNGALGPVWHLPVSLTACSLLYNLPGVAFNLSLDGATLAAIFSGDITTWDAAPIVALNPAIASEPSLVNRSIEAVARGEKSTSSYHLTDYLTRTAGAAWSQGRTESPIFGASVVRKDDGGALAAYVASTPYTIGYAKKRTAARAGGGPDVREALMLNAAGRMVAPSAAAIQEAASALAAPMPDPSLPHDDVFPGASLAAGAYPLTQFAWVVTFAQYTVNDSSVPSFIEYISSDAAQASPAVVPAGYISLPSALRSANAAAAGRMTLRGAPEFPPLPSWWKRDDGHVLGVILGMVLGLLIVFGGGTFCCVRTGLWARLFYKPEAAARASGRGAGGATDGVGAASDEMDEDDLSASPHSGGGGLGGAEHEMVAVRPAAAAAAAGHAHANVHTIGGFSDLGSSLDGGDGDGDGDPDAEMLDSAHAVRITLAHDQLAGDDDGEDQDEDDEERTG